MIDMTFHFRGWQSETKQVAAVPAVGQYIEAGNRLWLFDNVVYSQGVDVYAIEVSSGLAQELKDEWATWCKTVAAES